MINTGNTLETQAFYDLCLRARSGIFFYLPMWLVISIPSGLHHSHPQLFFYNFLLLVLIACIRYGQYHVASKKKNTNVTRLQRWLILGVSINALHWGSLTGLVLMDPKLANIQLIMVLATAGFAATGACVMSISNTIRNSFPLLLIGPGLIACLLEGSEEKLIIATMAALLVAYTSRAARITHNDYWAAITNRQLSEQRSYELQRLSVTDTLTQLHNRMYFDQQLTLEWNRGQRVHTPLALLLLDLDHFKHINDTYGHVCGDLCLQQVAEALASITKRTGDCLARYGGEEFVILLPNTDQTAAAIVAERLLEAVAKVQISYEQHHISMTASIGLCATMPHADITTQRLIKTADDALYSAKHGGRNCYFTGTI